MYIKIPKRNKVILYTVNFPANISTRRTSNIFIATSLSKTFQAIDPKSLKAVNLC